MPTAPLREEVQNRIFSRKGTKQQRKVLYTKGVKILRKK